MTKTTRRNQFSRVVAAADLASRRADLEDQRRAYAADKTLDPNTRRLLEVVTNVRISECQRFIDHWKLEKL